MHVEVLCHAWRLSLSAVLLDPNVVQFHKEGQARIQLAAPTGSAATASSDFIAADAICILSMPKQLPSNKPA